MRLLVSGDGLDGDGTAGTVADGYRYDFTAAGMPVMIADADVYRLATNMMQYCNIHKRTTEKLPSWFASAILRFWRKFRETSSVYLLLWKVGFCSVLVKIAV